MKATAITAFFFLLTTEESLFTGRGKRAKALVEARHLGEVVEKNKIEPISKSWKSKKTYTHKA